MIVGKAQTDILVSASFMIAFLAIRITTRGDIFEEA
jgi:hypothetical protein